MGKAFVIFYLPTTTTTQLTDKKFKSEIQTKRYKDALFIGQESTYSNLGGDREANQRSAFTAPTLAPPTLSTSILSFMSGWE